MKIATHDALTKHNAKTTRALESITWSRTDRFSTKNMTDRKYSAGAVYLHSAHRLHYMAANTVDNNTHGGWYMSANVVKT